MPQKRRKARHEPKCKGSCHMKRMTAREVLAESFRELAMEKSIERITVRKIAENCEYSSATFYQHFRDKYDRIAWDYKLQHHGNRP